MERLWNANYNRVMLVNFTLFFSFYLLTPLLPLYLSETFGAGKDTIGWVLSGYTLLALLTRAFSGYLADTFPRKRMLLISLAAYFLLFAGYLVPAGGLLLFALVRTIHGAPYGAATVANSTMAVDVLPSTRRNEGIGYYGLSNNLASALAPMAGLAVYHATGNFRLIFLIAFLTAAVGLLTAYTIRAPRREKAPGRQVLSLDRFFLVPGWRLAMNMTLFGACWGVLSNYLAIYGKEQLGQTSGTGPFFLVLSAGLIASRLQGSKALRQGRLTQNALAGILLSTIGYTLFIAWDDTPGYFLAALLIGLGNGHLWPAFQNMILAIGGKERRGTANSTLLTSWDLGMGLGILGGGLVAEHVGYAAAFWATCALHVFALALFVGLTRPAYPPAGGEGEKPLSAPDA